MFIRKEEYDQICDLAEERRKKLAKAEERIEELSASKTTAMAEVIYHRENNQTILETIEGNTLGRTDKQKLRKIKEVIVG